MRSGQVLEWVFPDDAAADRFAGELRGAFEVEGGRSGAGRLKTLIRRTMTEMHTITLRSRVVRLELSIFDNMIGHLAEEGVEDADDKVIAGLNALAGKHGGQEMTAGHFRREQNAARLASLQAEGRRVLALEAAGLHDNANIGERGRWMARAVNPPDGRVRGTWAVLSDDEPRRFEGVLDRGVLALNRDREDTPPRWQAGDLIELVEGACPAAVPESLFTRLRRALIG